MTILYTTPTREWNVLGLQEQALGRIVCFALDSATGMIKSMALRTEWQTIDIQWFNLTFDERRQSFRLKKSATLYRLAPQESCGNLAGN